MHGRGSPVVRARCLWGGGLPGAVVEALLEGGQVGAAVVVLGKDAGQAHQRLHAGETVLEALDVLGPGSFASAYIFFVYVCACVSWIVPSARF